MRLVVAAAFLLGVGAVGMLVASVLDHYDFHRLQWFVGEGGFLMMVAGAVLGLFVIAGVLWQTRERRDDG